MGRLARAQSIEEKFAPRIAQLFGVQALPVEFRVGQLSDGRAAEASYGAGSVTFDREFLRGSSREDFRGAIIHELTHAYGVGSGKSDKRVETLADYARLSLNKNEDPDWDPSRSVLNMARRNDMTAGVGNNGPKVGDGNRMRNTAANIFSKSKVDYTNPGGAAALPALDPSSTANYYSQLGGLYAGYEAQRVQLKQARVGMRADFRESVTAARQNKLYGLATVENQAIERGVLGSSADLQTRAAVRGGAEGEIATARRARLEGVAGTRLEEQQAGINYFMGVQGLEAQKLAQQQGLLADQLARNLIVGGQETQMDALKAFFQASQAGLPGRNGGGAAATGPVLGPPPPPGYNVPNTGRERARLAAGGRYG